MIANPNEKKYRYIGDRHSDPKYKGKECKAVVQKNGKCIRGRNGNMLVEFEDGTQVVVVAKLLRKFAFKSNNIQNQLN